MGALGTLSETATAAGWCVTVRQYNAPVNEGLRFARGYVTIDLIAHNGGVHAQAVGRDEDGRVTDDETFTDVEAIERLLQS